VSDKTYIRPPASAGAQSFYPDDPDELSKEVTDLLKRAPVKSVPGEIKGIVAPHAGYVYSGYTAAAAYKLLEGKTFKTVVIISPSHRDRFEGVSVFDGRGYRTPLGVVDVDTGLREEIRSSNGIIVQSNVGHRSEHALEVQLPFLQSVLKDFRILPLVMGVQYQEYCEILADNLSKALAKKSALIVASSDLSHYHDYTTANELDAVVVDSVNRLDPHGLLDKLEKQMCEACGGGPIAAMLMAASKLGANHAEVVHYCNSGDITGDRSRVVGYLSAVVWKA
jgi:AmmeMemoRadiSam system protein B